MAETPNGYLIQTDTIRIHLRYKDANSEYNDKTNSPVYPQEDINFINYSFGYK
jgi:hypothetical protein